MNTPENETPLTDAVQNRWKTQIRCEDEIWNFARELERDRKRLREALDALTNVARFLGHADGSDMGSRALDQSRAIDAKLAKETK